MRERLPHIVCFVPSPLPAAMERLPHIGWAEGVDGQFENDSQIMTHTRAALLYVALTVPLAIASHLVGEALALHESLLSAATSPLHIYLGAIALGCLATSAWIFVSCRGEFRRLSGLFANGLPFHGRGWRFFGISAGIQFIFASWTLLGEQSLNPATALLALIAVAIASVLFSAVLTVVRERLVHIDVSQFVIRAFHAIHALRAPRVSPFGPYYAYVPARGNRPPPLAFPVR